MTPLWMIGLALLATVVFVGLDLRDEGFRSGWWRDRVRARRNLAYLASNLVTMVALSAATSALTPHVPRLIDWSGWRALEIGACFMVAELINWLAHWVKHRVPYLWTFHLQHHVESHYNTTLTLHTHGLEVVVTGALMSATLVLCGFSQLAIDVFLLSYFAANLYKHCSAKMSLGPLDWLIVSPAFHRVHHAKHENANFGSVLTLWDVVFRTARFVKDEDAYALSLGTTGDEPFGFKDEMLAFIRPRAR
jgi:sterol desaturase/sphingolipid hydroxylase (fatty acid hydroxylase superfamily)